MRFQHVAFVLSLWALTVGQTAAQDFYKGKTVRLIVATTPGGGFDAYSRMLARHWGKYIPGQPTFVVENPVSGEELEKIVHGLFKADPAIVNKLRDLLK